MSGQYRRFVLPLSCMMLLIAASISQPLVANDEPPEEVLLARDLSRQLGSELKQTLIQAIENEGLVAALSVCRVRAPEIAAIIGQRSGARVGRVSSHYRNPVNQPNPWQSALLVEFNHRQRAGEDPAALEAYRTVDGRFEYLKAIAAASPCLSCHGQTLSPEVNQALARLYPEDLALGYEVGQIRGAFAISLPVDR